MGMKGPEPSFGYIAQQLRTRFPQLVYVNLVEPRVEGVTTRAEGSVLSDWSNNFIRKAYGSGDGPSQSRIISAGGYTRSTATEVVDTKCDLVAFGRLFIASNDIPLNADNRKIYYRPGKSDGLGYTDYSFAGQTPASGELGNLTSRL